jgi:hypothetical protein
VGHAAAPEPAGVERRGSKVARHMAVLEPSHLGSRDPELRDQLRRVDARPAPSPNLELVRRGTRSAGYR